MERVPFFILFFTDEIMQLAPPSFLMKKKGEESEMELEEKVSKNKFYL